MHWYNPNSRVAETVTAPYTDQEEEYMLLGTPDSWAYVAEYGRLRDDGMSIEQAMIFVGHRFRMWHLRYEKSARGREAQEVISKQARVGKEVRVRGDRYEPEVRGVVGSVLRCYGEPEYMALEVIPKDGRSRIFWHYEVEEAEDQDKSV